MEGGTGHTVNTRAVAFETQNGETIIAYYNKECQDIDAVLARTQTYVASIGNAICLNMIYDLNGSKGPNTMGKDMGIMTVFYSTDSVVVAPMPTAKDESADTTLADASSICTASDPDSRIPNREEAMAIMQNGDVLKAFKSNWTYLTSTTAYDSAGNKTHWIVDLTDKVLVASDSNGALRCVKR